MPEERVKLMLEFETSTGIEVESIWAIVRNGGLEVDNIPFYAEGVALGDLVSFEIRANEYVLNHLLNPSGHSTVQIWVENESDVLAVRNEFRAIGCESEQSDKFCLLALDVPLAVPYELVKVLLEAGERQGRWDYKEACLGYLHED